VSLELGGKNPIIVMDDADLELALEGALWGAFGTSGQRCTAASRLIVQKGVLDGFTSELVGRASKLRIGNGLDPEIDMGPVINREQLERFTPTLRSERKKEPRFSWEERSLRWFARERVFLLAHNLRRRQLPNAHCPGGDFRPHDCHHAVRDYDEAVRVANSVEFGLRPRCIPATSIAPSMPFKISRPGSFM